MATFSKIPLSGSTHGRGVKVVATATPGTTVHTAAAVTTDGLGDEVWLWAQNDDTAERTLTIEFGGATDPDDLIVVPIPPQSGLVPILPGLIIRNSLVVRAFASTANVLTLWGYVNRISA